MTKVSACGAPGFYGTSPALATCITCRGCGTMRCSRAGRPAVSQPVSEGAPHNMSDEKSVDHGLACHNPWRLQQGVPSRAWHSMRAHSSTCRWTRACRRAPPWFQAHAAACSMVCACWRGAHCQPTLCVRVPCSCWCCWPQALLPTAPTCSSCRGQQHQRPRHICRAA